MIPQIDNSIDDTNLVNEVILPSRTYKLSSNYETKIKYGDTQNVVGENIILTNAAEAKLKKLDIKGNTKQDTTTGKNLLGKEWEYGGLGGGGVNQNDGATNYIRTKDYVEIEPDTTYTLSFQDTDIEFSRANIILFNESKEADEEALGFYYNTDDNTWTFTTSSTDHYFRFTARKLGTAWDLSNIKFQIEKGSTATSYEPYTGGIASPNPEYPQDIQVVSGSIVVNTSNKNWLKTQRLTTKTLNGITFTPVYTGKILNYINVNGTATATTVYEFEDVDIGNPSKYISKLSAGSYILSDYSGTSSSANSTYIRYTTNGSTFEVKNSVSDKTFTLSQDCKYIAYIRIQSGSTFSNMKFKPQLEKSSTETAYEPHQGKELPLDLPVENLFDGGFQQGTLRLNGAGDEATSNTRIRTGYISVIPNTTYTISNNNSNIYQFGVGLYKSDNSYDSNHKIESGGWINFPYTFTTQSDTYYLRMVFKNSTDTSLAPTGDYEIMVENNVKANAYTPYGTDPIELCEIGNYQDYFYKSGSKWYLHKEIGKIVLNGTESGWGVSTTNTSGYNRFANSIISSSALSPSSNSEIAKLLSNILTATSANSNYTRHNGITLNANGTLYIYYTDIASYTIEQFKTWLTSNNITLYYVLKTATNTEITDTTLISQLDNLQKAKAYQGTTYIYTIANEISPILDVDYYPLSSIYYETAQVDRISGFIDDKDAIKQAVYHILSIERYSCLIYDDNYGVELQQYIGQDFEYLKVTIQKTLEEALMQDERIISINVIDIEKINNETANVKLSIQANVGEIQMEVNVNV